MKQAAALLAILTALSSAALADKITLKDGRTFEGVVSQEEGKVLVKMALGTVSFPASEVSSIENMATSEDQLEAMLVNTRRDDPEAMLKVAVWARDNDLSRRSEDLLHEIINLSPDHPTARKMLGQMKIDSKWMELPAALQLAQNKLEAGKMDLVLEQLLPAMGELGPDAQQLCRIKHLEAQCQLAKSRYDKARQAYEELADKCSGAEAVRYAAIADILKSHPDGMFVLPEEYPPTASLLGGASVQAGPAPLSDKRVLAAAMHERAKVDIKAGRAAMDEGKKLESAEPEAAKAKYSQADKSFDVADALVTDLCRSYRVELARRRIAIVSLSMNAETRKYDLLKDDLGKRDLTPAAYKDLVVKMLRALNNARTDMEAIIQLAGPFDRELVLELTDARLGLQKVNALRDILNQELNGR